MTRVPCTPGFLVRAVSWGGGDHSWEDTELQKWREKSPETPGASGLGPVLTCEVLPDGTAPSSHHSPLPRRALGVQPGPPPALTRPESHPTLCCLHRERGQARAHHGHGTWRRRSDTHEAQEPSPAGAPGEPEHKLVCCPRGVHQVASQKVTRFPLSLIGFLTTAPPLGKNDKCYLCL